MSISLRTKYLSIKKEKLSETAKGLLKSMYEATDGFKEPKATKKLKPKFESFYDKLVKSKPEAIKGQKPKESSAASSFKEARERRQAQAGVPKGEPDIKKDAGRPAIDTKGKRVTDGTHYPYKKGNVYYEYRDNRYDKRPSKYPKLEKGGEMAKGGKTKDFGEVYNAVVKYIMKDQKISYDEAAKIVDEKEAWLRDMVEYNGETNARFLGEEILTTDEGLYMAKGGKTQGYDDREDERLGMKDGKMSMKDLDSTHARRDDAQFEERMADGGETKKAKEVWGKMSIKERMDFLKDEYKDKIKGDNLLAKRLQDESKLNWDDLAVKIQMELEKKISKNEMADGGMSQGYDDREDERLAMKYGKMADKDLNSAHARRDDARFEERMAEGGMMADGGEIESIPDDYKYIGSTDDYKAKFQNKNDGSILEVDNYEIDPISSRIVMISPKESLMRYFEKNFKKGGMMAKGGEVNPKYKNSILKMINYKIDNRIGDSMSKISYTESLNLKNKIQNDESIDKKEIEYIKEMESYLSSKRKLDKVADISYNESFDFVDNIVKMADGGMMAHGGETYADRERMYNFLKDDLITLQKFIDENNQEEIEKFFSYWNYHLNSLEPKMGSKRMYNFLKDDLVGLEAATKELPSSKEETDRFFSYWNTHLKSLSDEDLINMMAHGGETHRSQGGDLFADGGETDNGNVEMVMSNTKAIEHHAKELKELVNMNTPIEAWVVAKLERAETDLSDVTHYIDGLKSTKFADGGELDGHDVEIYFSTKDKVADPYTVIIDGSVYSMSGTTGPMSVSMYVGEIDEFEPQLIKGWGKKINFVDADPQLISQISDRFEEEYADGGMMAKGGLTKEGNRLMHYEPYFEKDVIVAFIDEDKKEVRPTHGYFYPNKIAKKVISWAHKNGYEFNQDDKKYADGGMMAKGGMTRKGGQSFEVNSRKFFYHKDDGNVYDSNHRLYAGSYDTIEQAKKSLEKNFEDAKGGMMAKGGKLVGKQKNLDVNKNGKLDAEDFKMLRGDDKMSKGGRITKDWTGRKGKETWGKKKLYGEYDNNLDLVADVHDYYADMAKDIDENYANEMKKDVVEVMKTGKITSGDGSTLTFAKGGKIAPKAKYIPKYQIEEVEVDINGKEKEIDGADLLNGLYVKKAAYERKSPVKKAKGGEIKPKSKRKGGDSVGKIAVLAKQIRKEGEKWTDAIKRASAQLKKA